MYSRDKVFITSLYNFLSHIFCSRWTEPATNQSGLAIEDTFLWPYEKTSPLHRKKKLQKLKTVYIINSPSSPPTCDNLLYKQIIFRYSDCDEKWQAEKVPILNFLYKILVSSNVSKPHANFCT